MGAGGSVETGNAHWTIDGEMDGLTGAVVAAKAFVVKQFKDLSGSVGTIFLGMGIAGAAAFASIGVAAVNIASDVQGAAQKVRAQLGLTEDQAARFADTIKEVYGNNFGDSLDDVGESVATTFAGLQTVLDDAEVGLQKNTENALALRDAFDIDVATSIDTVSALIKNFGLTSDEAFDFVTAGMQRGLNKSGDFLESVSEYSNQFAAGGATAEQFFSLLESGLGAGVNGTDKAADAFKEFRIRIEDGSSATADALASLGFNAAAFTNELSTGQKTVADAFQEVIERLRQTNDSSLRLQAGVGLLGTQFEDLGEQAVFGLDLAQTKMSDLAGSTETLNEQYNTLGSAVEGIRRKFILSLEPIGAAMLLVINEHLPDIEAAFVKLSELGPELAGIFAEALDVILNTIVPATVATAEFVAEHKELIASVIEFTIKAAPYLISMGAILKIIVPLTAAVGAFGSASTTAAGVGTAGGMAGMTAASAPLLAALIPVFGTAGIVSFAVVSLGLFLRALADVKVAEEQLVDSNKALESTIDRRLAQLREQGVLLDEVAIKELDLSVQAQAISDAEDDARAETLRSTIEHFAGRTAAEEEFVQARNLALNDNLTNEEAAQVALMELDAATKTALLRADEQQTEAILIQLGIRTAAKEAAVEEEVLGALTAAEFQIAAANDVAASNVAGYQISSESAAQWVADLKAGSFSLRSDMSDDAVAIRQAQKAAAEEALEAYRASFSESADAAQFYSDLLLSLTKEDGEAYKALDETQRASVDNLIENMQRAGKSTDEIAAGIRESLKRLSLDHRESPSINDVVGDSLATYVGMMEDRLGESRSLLDGLREAWFDTWFQIGDFVSSTLSNLFDQAQAFINSLGFALGGVARVLGFAGGGVVGYAGGGAVRPLVPVIANEHGIEPMFLPEGTRIIAHGEAIQALERGAQSGNITIDLGGASFNVRQPADIAAIARGLGDRVFDRMSQIGTYRGLTQQG